MIIDNFLVECPAWIGVLIQFENGVRSIEQVIFAVEDVTGNHPIPRFGTFDEPFLSIVAPCGEAYVFQPPDDFPLEDVACRCGNERHRVVAWEAKEITA